MGNPKITLAELATKLKRSKYGVKHDEQGKADRTYKGVLYHSKRECEYAQELDLLKSAGKIEHWERQVIYPIKIQPNDKDREPLVVFDYVADFLVYRKKGEPGQVVDVKGKMTEEARLKIKMFEAQYGRKVEIVR